MPALLPSAAPPTNLLRHVAPEVLTRLTELHARFGSSLAAGTNAQIGSHTSARRGHSVEFHEHRDYTQGDDVRHVDWRGSARRDRLIVKRFDHEGQVTRALLVDASASMQIGGAAASKLHFAATCLSVVGHVLAQGGDPLRVAALAARAHGTAVLSHQLPLREALAGLADIASLAGKGTRGLAADLEHIGTQLAHHPSELIIASDFFDRSDSLHILRALALRGHAITVFMVLAPSELTLPFRGITTFVSPESGQRMMTNPADIRLRYVAAIKQHVASWHVRCHEAGMRFVLGTTDVEASAAHLLGIAPMPAEWSWA